MSNRSDAFQVCEVGEASVLHQILGGHKIAKIERVARAARVRDLLLSLKGAALQMEHDDRMAFAELVELARAEHHAANHDQECQIEIEAAVANVTHVMGELARLGELNQKLHSVALRLQEEERARMQGASFRKWFNAVGAALLPKTKKE